MSFRIVDEPLDPAPAFAAVRDPACGAVATFVGTVRGTSAGKEVLRLEYEVLESMALRQFEKMAGEFQRKHGVRHVAIHHRRGAVEVGGVSVVIAVSAERRRSALIACAEAIEILKKDVPIWKKEVYPDGHHWMEGS
ncbi:MAG: molybdenum cofactor biosynthesis protein MoaE [Planctomycetota bacterium]|jgi:molybdopterin synthase catalytic subunit